MEIPGVLELFSDTTKHLNTIENHTFIIKIVNLDTFLDSFTVKTVESAKANIHSVGVGYANGAIWQKFQCAKAVPNQVSNT